MTRSPSPALLLLFLCSAAPGSAQESRADAPPPAPVLIPWERTLEDAEALSHETGRPLLVCVNANGEPASEFLVRRRYNDPSFAALVQGFVPVMISVDRHTPTDWDAEGLRIPCPRFGTIVCSEHIDAEPLAYERYFAGEAVAPRHIGVAPDGTVLFDLLWLDIDQLVRVDEALAAHGKPTPPRWESELAERSSVARARLEGAYLAAPPRTRRAMLERAAESAVPHAGLFRLGLHEDDVELRRAAARGLARTADAASEGTLLAALRLALPDEEHAALVDALERVAKSEGSLRLLADLRAVRTPSARVDASAWRTSWPDAGAGGDAAADAAADGDATAETDADGDAPPAVAADGDTPPQVPDEALYRAIDELSAAVDARPSDPAPELEMARTWLALGQRTLAAGKNPTFLFMDARTACERALAKGAAPSAVAPTLTLVEWLLGETDAAAKSAEDALAALPGGASPSDAVQVLAVFALSRTSAIYAARGQGQAAAPELLSDAHAAFGILAEHPLGTEEHARAHADLLLYLDLQREAGAALVRALARFPESADLHERFRRHVIATQGATELEGAYAALGAGASDPATHQWFTAYALLLAAEDAQRSNESERADRTYARATREFQASVVARPDYADATSHYVALCTAGRARLAIDREDHEIAAALAARAVAVRPESAELADGLGRSPLDTLRRVRRALEAAGRTDLVSTMEASVGSAAPEIWSKAGL